MVDTYVARALVEAAQAVRLLGCDVSLCGISAAVAMTMTNLQIDLQRIITTRSPQEAIELYRKNKAAEGASQAGIKLYGLN
jgi:anti-anti-sigma regulatory factor